MVELVDATAPSAVLKSPPVSLSADATCGAVLADLTELVGTGDACSAVTVTQLPVAGSPLALGATDITFTAVDASSNGTPSLTTIAVVDDEAPTLTAPSPVEVVATEACDGLVPALVATAADNCTTNLTVVQTPPAGSALLAVDLGAPVTVTFETTDEGGSTTSATTTVTLIDINNHCGDTPGAGAEIQVEMDADVHAPDATEQPLDVTEPTPDTTESDAGPVVVEADETAPDNGPSAVEETSSTVAAEDAGCGCRTAGPRESLPFGSLLLLLLSAALLGLARRKTTGRDRPTN